MEIKPGKYRTREGAESVVLETYNNRAYGRYKSHNEKFGWVACDWSLSGVCFMDHALDLIAPWEDEKPRLRVWRNIDHSSPLCGALVCWPGYSADVDDPTKFTLVPELDALFEVKK